MPTRILPSSEHRPLRDVRRRPLTAQSSASEARRGTANRDPSFSISRDRQGREHLTRAALPTIVPVTLLPRSPRITALRTHLGTLLSRVFGTASTQRIRMHNQCRIAQIRQRDGNRCRVLRVLATVRPGVSHDGGRNVACLTLEEHASECGDPARRTCTGFDRALSPSRTGIARSMPVSCSGRSTQVDFLGLVREKRASWAGTGASVHSA